MTEVCQKCGRDAVVRADPHAPTSDISCSGCQRWVGDCVCTQRVAGSTLSCIVFYNGRRHDVVVRSHELAPEVGDLLDALVTLVRQGAAQLIVTAPQPGDGMP